MSFDLNINNYKMNELIDIFQLSSNYDKYSLETNELKLRENIMKNQEISQEIKMKTVEFLFKAKNILLNINPTVSSNDSNQEFQETIKEFYNSSYKLKPVKVNDQYGHVIQEKKELPYLSSFPSEFFPGVINPLKKRINRQNLNIDTRFRDNYYGSSPSNFNLILPMQFTKVVSMQLNSIELPLTFFNISKQLGCNFFTIHIFNSSGSNLESNVISIPDGNYDQTGIVSIINQQLTDLGGFYAGILFGINYTGNNGSGQMIALINHTYSGTPFNFSLDFQADRYGNCDNSTPLPLKFGWILGFRNGVYENNSNYVSESIVDLNTIKYVYLVVDDYNNSVNNGFYSAFNSSILNKNILARISLQSPAFNVLSENNLHLVTQPREYFGPVTVQNLTIQLLDPYGRVLDLNNNDYSFCLTMQTVYDI
jgi:hypothetical protein